VLKKRLDGLGDSLLVVGTGDLHNVHVHVDDVGAAIEAGIALGDHTGSGSPTSTTSGRSPPDQDAPGRRDVRRRGGAGRHVPRRPGRGWFASGPRRRANAAQFLEAGRSTGAGRVILLPNDGDTLLAANAAAKVAAEEGIDLRVVAARTAVQGIAALAVYDSDQAVRRQRPDDEQRRGRHSQRRGHRGDQGGADLGWSRADRATSSASSTATSSSSATT
jgi:hypothetical protein